MGKLTEIKLYLTAVLSALSAWLGTLAVPVYILVGLNIADYATGVAAAHYRGERVSSNLGFRGIAKKVCMWLLVALGAAVDWLVLYAAGQLGFSSPLSYLAASAVAIWLICNELLSILENIADIGVQPPGFLKTLIGLVKDQAESKGEDNHE
jgi:toxin secretion/phage lysis holin